ncbi:MAG: ProQ/FINO family protein, partial [Aquabacterium sp.]|nr:ProQ/FINO family protein [Aquabacterium sp.]
MPLTPDHPTTPADAAPVTTEPHDTQAPAPVDAADATPAAEPVASPPTGTDAQADTSAPEPAAGATEPPAEGRAADKTPAPQAPVETAESTDAGAAPPPAAASRAPEMSLAACADLLKQHFPALFGGPAKPLKLRIQADIKERAPGVFSKGALSAFFRRYTGSTSYLIALSKAEHRFDLDGQAAGELSEEHRQLAQEELTRRRQLTREREQQARAGQRAQAPQQPRAEGAADA